MPDSHSPAALRYAAPRTPAPSLVIRSSVVTRRRGADSWRSSRYVHTAAMRFQGQSHILSAASSGPTFPWPACARPLPLPTGAASPPVPSRRLSAQEGLYFLPEVRVGGLVLQDQVIAALEGHEAGAGDGRGHAPAAFERNADFLAGVHHQRRNADLAEQIRDIRIATGLQVTDGVLR